jgi:hypothetical protein
MTEEQARELAEAECILRNVRQHKSALMDDVSLGQVNGHDSALTRSQSRRRDLRKSLEQLIRLDRYERAALSRRNRLLG